MAFEVFDDVAFYFLAMSVIASITLGWSIIKLSFFLSNHFCQRQANLLDPAAPLLQKKVDKPKKPWFTFRNVLFVCLWVVLVLLMVQLPSIQQSELVSFDPYSTLQLPKDANLRQIGKAYRTLSLLHHPDKNPGDAAAAEKFLEVQRAHDILSDPIKKKDWDDGFLNPQKSAATSVTIGLPSWLTKKENEMRVLVVYFVLFMVLPPVAVFLWWKNAKNYNETGVHNRTLQVFIQLMNPNMGPKYLLELLSFAAEFEPLQQNVTEAQLKCYKNLYDQVKDEMVREKFYDPHTRTNKFGHRFDYVHRANVLLHAYMLRVSFPDVLRPHLDLVTQHAHRLLNVMLEVAMARSSDPRTAQFIQPALGCIDLMQLLSQAMWPHDSPLLQLEGVEPVDLKYAKQVRTIAQFRRLTPDKRSKMFPHVDADKLAKLAELCEYFPEVSLTHQVSIEGEDANTNANKLTNGNSKKEIAEPTPDGQPPIYENDLITITATVERLQFDPNRVEQAGRQQVVEEGDEDAVANIDSADDKNKDKDKSTPSPSTPSPKSTTESHETASSSSSSSSSSEEDEEDEEFDVNSVALDELAPPVSKKVEKWNEAPIAYAPRIPHDKRERWVVFLLEKTNKKMPRLIAYRKVPSLSRIGTNSRQQVKLTFQGPPIKGYYDFELHAICDSYIGCDKMTTFKLLVQKAPTKLIKSTPEESEEAGDEKSKKKKKNEPRGWFDDDENYEGKWYYFGLATFWELLLNLFVLGLLCVFIFNFMWSRGYWQRFVQPTVDTVQSFLMPVWLIAEPYVGPIVTPVAAFYVAAMDWVTKKLTVEPPPPIKKKVQDDFASTEVPDHVKVESHTPSDDDDDVTTPDEAKQKPIASEDD